MSSAGGQDGRAEAAQVRELRGRLGLSQEQLAARLGLGYAPGGRKVSTGRASNGGC